MANSKVTVIAPTLNEIEGVQRILPQVKCDQLIILDGRSTDGTIEWCKEHGYDVYVHNQYNMWEAYREIFRSGIVKGDIVITFSPDGNSLPEAIPALVKAIEADGYDMVIGSRYLGGIKSDDDTKLTAMGNRVLTWLCSKLAGTDYTDALVMLRAYKRDLPLKLGFMKEPNWFQRLIGSLSNLYGWESSMSIRAGKAKMAVGEIPVPEPKAYRERRQNTFVHGFVIISQILYEGGLK